MCGIHLQVWKDASCLVCQETFSEEHNNLRRRGPDACQGVSLEMGDYHKVHLQASVLQMRQELVTQPVRLGDRNCYMCWNGEVYQASEQPDVWNYETSDTLLVANQLQSILNPTETDQCSKETTSQEISKIMGRFYNAEFAFLILTPEAVYYGRDAWGRRSLLRWDCPNHCGSFQIVSTAELHNTDEQQEHWTEILPGMVHEESSWGTTTEEQRAAAIPYPSISFESNPKSMSSDFSPAPSGVSDELWKASIELELYLRRAVAMRLDPIRSSAVLFSGGLDSAVVAALAASQSTSHPLTLYNVSFGPSYEKSADRQAALITCKALQDRYSNIVYEDIIVEWEDICQHEPHIRTLLQPKMTLMDVNIATALWFASRGGKSEMAEEKNNDRPRVLLLGMGADEQMGGYGRHRKAFERGGWEELEKELKMDQSRFWERNLGRDDRICADHGKEARFPFLDAHVVRFLNGLPLDLVCDFSLPPGQGDKRILRLVAMRLGLDHASGLVKRAIQFGSRISHLSDAKRFGSRRKAKGGATVKAKAS
jgi:asparagine synthetase B (glutamine-hydrolysing)